MVRCFRCGPVLDSGFFLVGMRRRATTYDAFLLFQAK